ncbi:hypothetical protein J2W56_000289 [Nocardia kruczakiae]|uniref:Uncharacterized protein n=1 Tax=Nocardia kruczakiae TaxID=261477 RepID=A0ABU1X908_9NOCA|nr:hypothetical protein [Nocardia kruczakiae]
MPRWSEFAGAAPRIAGMDVVIWKPAEGETVVRKL